MHTRSAGEQLHACALKRRAQAGRAGGALAGRVGGAHTSAGSRSTTCRRWMVKTPGRARSVFVPRQCLQMMRPVPRHTSHSLVKMSFSSR